MSHIIVHHIGQFWKQRKRTYYCHFATSIKSSMQQSPCQSSLNQILVGVASFLTLEAIGRPRSARRLCLRAKPACNVHYWRRRFNLNKRAQNVCSTSFIIDKQTKLISDRSLKQWCNSQQHRIGLSNILKGSLKIILFKILANCDLKKIELLSKIVYYDLDLIQISGGLDNTEMTKLNWIPD